MGEVQRYYISGHDWEAEEDPAPDERSWVRSTDHDAAVAALEARVRELEEYQRVAEMFQQLVIGEGAWERFQALTARAEQAEAALSVAQKDAEAVNDALRHANLAYAQAAEEMACCDDVPLQMGLAVAIGHLRQQRDSAEAECEEVRTILDPERQWLTASQAAKKAAIKVAMLRVALAQQPAVVAADAHGNSYWKTDNG